MSYVDSVYAWRRASASAVVGEARAWPGILWRCGVSNRGQWAAQTLLVMGQQIGGLFIKLNDLICKKKLNGALP